MREPATTNGGLPKACWITSWIVPATGAGGAGGGGGAGVVLGGAGTGAGVVGVAAPAASAGTSPDGGERRRDQGEAECPHRPDPIRRQRRPRAWDCELRACAHAASARALIRMSRERVQ